MGQESNLPVKVGSLRPVRSEQMGLPEFMGS